MPLRSLFSVPPPKGAPSTARVCAAWNASGTLLCCVGATGLASLYDRSGTQTAQVQLESRAQCTRLDWDRDGEACVIVQAGVDRVAVLEVSSAAPSVLYVDSGLKEVTLAAWSQTGPQLALGSASGGLVLYRRDTRKKLPIAGKHSAAITCGAWSADGRLALGSADRTVSVSTPEGDELDRVECRVAPAALQWGGLAGAEGLAAAAASSSGGSGSSGAEAAAAVAAQGALLQPALAINLGGRGVFLWTPGPSPAVAAAFPATELQFQQRYGAITAARWFQGGYMALGFSEGYLVVVSTHPAELGEELFSSGSLVKGLPVEDVAVSPSGAHRIAVAAGAHLRLVDTATWAEAAGEGAVVAAGAGGEGGGGGSCIEALSWSRDGVMLTAVTRGGGVVTYLAAAPALCGASSALVVHMTGLKELAVRCCSAVGEAAEAAGVEASEGSAAAAGAGAGAAAGGARHVTAPLPPPSPAAGALFIPLPVEPSALGVGPAHIAVALHNRVWLYAVSPSAGAYMLAGERVLPEGVTGLTVTGSALCALAGGRLYVSALEEGGGVAEVTLPPRDAPHAASRVTAVAAGGALLYYGTECGVVAGVALGGGSGGGGGGGALPSPLVLGPGVGVRALGANALGTRVVVCDTLGRALLYDPIAGSALQVPVPQLAAAGAVSVHWDAVDRGVFVIVAEGAGAGAGGGSAGAGAGGGGSSAAAAAAGAAPGSAAPSPPTASPSSSSSSAAAAPSAASRAIHAFLYAPVTVSGPTVTPLGTASLAPDGSLANTPPPAPPHTPRASSPLALASGHLLCHCSAGGGGLVTVVLPSHAPLLGAGALLAPGARLASARARDIFSACLLLGRARPAWASAAGAASAGQAHAPAMLRAIAARAMEGLDAPAARRAYRALREPGLALTLAGIEEGGEDRAHVVGDICALFGDYGAAGEAYCASARGVSALELRLDLREWEAAEALAGALAPGAAPACALERAKGEEMAGRAEAALGVYRAALAAAEAVAAGAAGAASTAASTAAAPGSPLPSLGWYSDAGARVAGAARAGGAAGEAARVAAGARGGIARCTLRCGDVRGGAALALASGDAALCRECGALAESVGALGEAAALFRAAGAADRAAELYLRLGSPSAAAPLLAGVRSLRLQCAYGAAQEKEGDYAGAALAYERGRDVASLVRLMLTRLGQGARAGELVRALGSVEGAVLLAAHAGERGDWRGAIEFLLLARRGEEAFALAAKSGEMEVYVSVLVGGAAPPPPQPTQALQPGAPAAAPAAAPMASAAQLAALPRKECLRVGAYYEARGSSSSGSDAAAATLRAAQCFSAAGEYMRALGLLLSAASAPPPPAPAPADGSAAPAPASASASTAALIEEAVRLAGRAASPPVTAALLAFLRGEGGAGGGGPKDSRFIFSLHMALGAHGAAAAEALAIARCEQESPSGSFKTAHGILFDAYCALRGAGAPVPHELWRTLALLHSYLLVKRLIGAGEHEGAARMLARVVKSISRFPAHATPILTSAVVQCQRGGLRATAYELACTLQTPAHRGGVKEEFRRKIEAMVRKPTGEADAPHPPAPCPFCDAPVPAYATACASCQSTLPYCVVTGRHMTRGDCSACPACHFPALFGALSAAAAGGGYACPMCSSPIAPQSVSLHRDPVAFLRGVVGSEGGGEGGGE